MARMADCFAARASSDGRRTYDQPQSGEQKVRLKASVIICRGKVPNRPQLKHGMSQSAALDLDLEEPPLAEDFCGDMAGGRERRRVMLGRVIAERDGVGKE